MFNVTQASVVLAGLSVLTGVLILGGSLVFSRLVQREYPTPATSPPELPAAEAALLAKRSAAYRLGVLVLIGLAVLTAVEYAVGVFWLSIAVLFVIGLFKAGLIVHYFMHITSLWTEEGH